MKDRHHFEIGFKLAFPSWFGFSDPPTQESNFKPEDDYLFYESKVVWKVRQHEKATD